MSFKATTSIHLIIDWVVTAVVLRVSWTIAPAILGVLSVMMLGLKLLFAHDKVEILQVKRFIDCALHS